MKKLFAVLLAITLVLSMGTIALAADDGKITIENGLNGETYKIYRIFDLESFSGDSYSYKLSEKWTNFATYTNGEAKASDYFTINHAGYVEWIKSFEDNSEDVKAFAELAKKFAATIQEDRSADASTDGAVEFDQLPLGYYFVDTTVGSICSLTTTNKEADITDKNTQPEIKKEVQEDSNNEWGETNDADIDQEVNFKATITTGKGTVNYVMHDTMSAGLTFDDDSVVVEGYVEGVDYNIVTNCECGCTFAVVFTPAFEEKVKEGGVDVVVTYSAVLNENAVIAGEGNPNEVYLSYGNAQNTTKDTTVTYTYQFQLVKTVDDGTVLPGATFKLYDAAEGGNQIYVVKESEDVYRVTKEETDVLIEAGYVTIKGLDSDMYYLEEIEAPTGYNKLTTRKSVEIKGENNDATVENGKYVENSGGVQVINRTGALLPETGGIGTTIFYVVGGLLMAAAFILLVSKKRMASFA